MLGNIIYFNGESLVNYTGWGALNFIQFMVADELDGN